MNLPLPTYTTDDLRAFPEDGQRYELLEGMLLVTPMPGSAHQIVLGRLFAALATYLSAADLAVAVSPGEIAIAPDARAVFVSYRGAGESGSQRDARQDARIVWRPSAMPAALEIDLSSVFRGVP